MDPTTAAATAVAANEAIQKIKPLLSELINRVKDEKTATLVSQIQALDQTIQAAYFDAKQEAINFASQNLELKRSHAHAIDNLNTGHLGKVAELEKEMARLYAAQRQPVAKPAEQLGDDETSVIRILASAEDGASDAELVHLTSKPLTTVKYLLETLERLGLADAATCLPTRGQLWELTTNGNAYAVKNNLVGNHPPGLPRRQQGFRRG